MTSDSRRGEIAEHHHEYVDGRCIHCATERDRYREALENLLYAIGVVRVSGMAARIHVLREACLEAEEVLNGGRE